MECRLSKRFFFEKKENGSNFRSSVDLNKRAELSSRKVALLGGSVESCAIALHFQAEFELV